MKRNNFFKALGIAALLGIGFTSCENKVPSQGPKENKGIENLKVSEHFDWQMQTEAEFKLTAKTNDDSPLTGASFSIYAFNPFNEEGTLTDEAKEVGPLFKGATDEQGKLSTQILVSKATEKLYVCPTYPSLPTVIEVDSEGRNEFSLNIGGKQIHKDAEIVTLKKNSSSFKFLSSYNWYGVPSKLAKPGDVLDASFLATVSNSLPERVSVAKHHKEYIAKDAEPNLILKKEAQVWLTFVHEGADYKNSVGYYTYPVGQEPSSKADIKKHIIAFPNTSLGHDKKGDLVPGDKIQLRYWNEAKQRYEDKFPANTVVAWFLIANAWDQKSYSVNANNRTVYSNEKLNIEKGENKRHNVLLFDKKRELLLLGFEDLNRDSQSCDHDFNDATFYTKVLPFDAVDDTDLEDVDDPEEEEEEEEEDNYCYFNSGTLAYEDLWPSKGDYDFNDLVIDYKYKLYTDYCGKYIKKLKLKYTVYAIGASFHNGFAIQFPVPANLVKSVDGAVLKHDYLNVAPNGTEKGQSMAVVPVFDDAYDILPWKSGVFVNTSKGSEYSKPVSKTITIEFTKFIPIRTLGLPPYNPFMIVNHKDEKRFAEVHLPNYPPSDLANEELWGTLDDDSDMTKRRSYLSDRNLPWALNIPAPFAYPYEKVDITEAHLHFAKWAESSGTIYRDWYRNRPGYRNSSNIYSK